MAETEHGVDRPAAGVPELPGDAILVHVGLHKTGTTAIQSLLAAAREDLAARDIRYPGPGEAHHNAARALLRRRTGWADSGSAPPSMRVWKRLAHKATEHPGRTVISSEFLSHASDEDVARLVETLGKERVHIVVGVRHFAPLALSAWQQALKAGSVHSLPEWLKRNFRRGKDGRAHGSYWEKQNAVGTVRRFAEAVGPERVYVVVIDEKDRQLLPGTFERLLGLPDGMLSKRTAAKSNRGMTAAEAELVRQVNVAVRDHVDWPEYALLVRNGMIRRLVEARPRGADEPLAVLPRRAHELAADEGAHAAVDIRATGAHVIGDLANLTLPPATTVTDEPAAVDLPVAAGVEAVIGSLAGALRSDWTLEAPRKVNTVILDKMTTRELARVVVIRVRAGLRRRIRRLRHRGPAGKPQPVAIPADATEVTDTP